MLRHDRRRIRRPRPAPPRPWLFVLLLPFLAAACITVSDTGESGASGAPSSAGPTLDPFATPTPVPLATPTPTPTPEPTPEPIAAAVFGFLPNWLLEDTAETLDDELLTTLALHGIEASADGRLVMKKGGDEPAGVRALRSDAFGNLRTRLQADDVDVVLVVQRFGWSDGTAQRTADLLGSRKARRQLANRIAALVEESALDGVTLDFEPVPAKLADQYVALVREVRGALDEVDEGLTLTVAVLPGLTGYDLPALTAADAADAAVIMGYNFRGDGAATAGSGAPLRDPSGSDLASTLDAALAQVPADKLILALPWFGKAWATETADAGAATRRGQGIDGPANVPYAEAVVLAGRSGRNYDSEQASAWTAYPSRQGSGPAVWRQLWYDDPDAFGAKIDHALEQGLAGIGIWAVGHEAGREELWQTIRSRLRPMDDTAPPNGSAALDPNKVLGDRDGVDVVEGSAPLLLFSQGDGEGSGVAYVRVSLSDAVGDDGRLIDGRTYPAVEAIDVPMGDPAIAGVPEPGPRTIHVQWRDIAGNWSAPLAIDAWALEPDGAASLDDV